MMPEGARTSDLYERDYYAWVQDQVAKLRELARRGTDTVLDLENLAEEVDDLGKSERNAVLSQLRRVMEHFLKLEYSPSDQARVGWKRSIVEARLELERCLTPTLRRVAQQQLAREYAGARKLAALALEEHGETSSASHFPKSCPYTLDQVLTEDWYPEPRP
jgi:hypothetical protein